MKNKNTKFFSALDAIMNELVDENENVRDNDVTISRVLRAVEAKGLKMSWATAHRKILQLVEQGKLKDDGKRIDRESNRRVNVWVVVG